MRSAAAAITECTKADVERIRTETAAIAERAKADVERIRTETATYAKHTEAETAAITSRVKLEMLHTLVPLLTVGTVGMALCVDFVLHDVRAVQRWRMMRRLRRCQVPRTAVAVPARWLPARVEPLRLGKLPKVLIGESGSGKSVQLALTARELAEPAAESGMEPCPVEYVRLRLPDSEAYGRSRSTDQLIEGAERMEGLMQQVFKQLEYPTRMSLVRQLMMSMSRLRFGPVEASLVHARHCSQRLAYALALLFEVAEELFTERVKAGIPIDRARPVLLFDDVHDLVKNSLLASVGGRYVFNSLAWLLVVYGTDRGAVRTAVAGSTALLVQEFDKTIASSDRVWVEEMPDPAPETITMALCQAGYTEDEARRMIALVGTRLRLLELPLQNGVKDISCQKFLNHQRELAECQFYTLLKDDDARADLVNLLERIRSHEAKVGRAPTVADIADEQRKLGFSNVLYLRLNGSVTFQSQLHRTSWNRLRYQYLPSQLSSSSRA